MNDDSNLKRSDRIGKLLRADKKLPEYLIAKVKYILENTTDDKVKLACIDFFADRSYGKARQAIDIDAMVTQNRILIENAPPPEIELKEDEKC